MALVECADCGQMVSSSAKACPKCGGPINRAGMSNVVKVVVGIASGVGLALIVMLALYLMNPLLFTAILGK